MNDLRVLHVIKRLDVVGGAERIVSELVRSSELHHVLVYDGGEPFFALGERSPIRARGLLHALLKIAALRASYDRVHLHLFPSIYLSLFLGRKSIIHEHNTHNRRRGVPVLRFVEQAIYARAGSIIAISEGARRSLGEWIGAIDRIKVVPNFTVDLPHSESAIQSPIPLGCRSILMVASFTEQKRQDLLISAAELLPNDIHLVFAGSGPTLRACKELADSRGLADRVHFLGSVSNVAPLYKHASICALISHWEGFGLVVLEAAKQGKPTVVSDVEGLRDLNSDSRFLFRGGGAHGLARTLLHALDASEDPEVAKASKTLAADFSFSGYLEKLNEIYKI